MDKKKVKELIEQIQKYCDQAYSPNWQPKSFEEFVKLGNICREAIKELSKSDWVSVADGITVYRFYDGGRVVYFTNKKDEVKTRHDEYDPVTKTTRTKVVETLCNEE